ncbi:MAG TPA: NAD(P)-dependent oxidoreductase [Pyrinomonadaceae bacterium]
MRILVTGGRGYLGTYVCQFFAADDFSRRSGFDLLNPDDVKRAGEYDAIIHLAAHFDKHPDGAPQCFRVNAEGTRNLLEHVKPGAIFIYASTKDVYGSHASATDDVAEHTSTLYSGQTAFEWSKLIGEQYVEYYAKARDFRACIFRMSTVFARPSTGNASGFVTHYVESIKHRQPIRLPAEIDPVRDILYVDDLSRACRSFINSSVPFGLYNLGGGRLNAVSLRGIIDRVSKMIEIEPVIEEDPRLPAPVPLRYVSDLTRIGNELNWRPQIGIDDGLRVLL